MLWYQPLKDTLFDQLYYNSEIEWLFTDFNLDMFQKVRTYMVKFNSDKEFKMLLFLMYGVSFRRIVIYIFLIK